MSTHVAHRDDGPFRAIAEGRKTIESRLYDEKRRGYALGDTIECISRTTGETLMLRVVGLLRYATFADMFTHNDPAKFGGESVDWLLDQIFNFYNADEECTYGVLGIEFELVKS